MLSAILLTAAAAALVVPAPGAAGDAVARMPAWVRTAGGWSCGRRTTPYLAGVAGGVIAAILGGPVAGALIAALVTTTWLLRRESRAADAAERQRSAAVEMVGALVAELRAGRPPDDALAAAAAVPGCDSVGAAARRVALGADVPAALRGIGDAGPLRAALGRVVIGWQVAERSGLHLADVLERVEADLRAAVELRRRVRVELAGTRATALVLAALPVLGVLLGTAMGAQPLRVLLHTSIGAGCTVAGLAFEAAGVLWIRRLARTAEGPS